MRIAIVGAGSIGANLGRGWARHEHEIRFAARTPSKLEDLTTEIGARATALEIPEAVEGADTIVLAVPWKAVDDVLPQLGNVAGTIVVDCTNPLRWDGGPVPILERSGAEHIAAQLPGAKVVKAFNTLGAEHLRDPGFGSQQADTFLCGDDDDARAAVGELAASLGFEVVDAGPLRNARLLEHLAILWIHLATVGGRGRAIAFKLLSK